MRRGSPRRGRRPRGEAPDHDLQRLDEFENRRFPRTRAVIQRMMPDGAREPMEAAFFKDLQQQPLGPLVVDSAATFISRFQALATSKESGAKLVHETLAKRGLTSGVLDEARALVEALKSAGKLPTVSPNAGEINEARAAQLEALEALRRWWNDWGPTLRPSFDVREQVSLGLTEVKVGTRTAPETAPTGADVPATD